MHKGVDDGKGRAAKGGLSVADPEILRGGFH